MYIRVQVVVKSILFVLIDFLGEKLVKNHGCQFWGVLDPKL